LTHLHVVNMATAVAPFACYYYCGLGLEEGFGKRRNSHYKLLEKDKYHQS